MKTEVPSRIYFPAHYVETPDRARIRYFDSEESLPAIVLANGLGGPVSAWAPYLRRWQGNFRVLTWDYRGLYGSTIPFRTADLSVSAHASDLRAVLDAAGIDRCIFLGWSMGVQVGLEFYSQNPNRISHLALINGTYGAPLGGVPLPFSHITLPPVVRGVQRMHRLGRGLINGLSQLPVSYSVLRGLRMIGPGLSRERFHEMIGDFRDVDLEVYFDLLAKLQEHDAEAGLRDIDVPTLVLAGSRDVLTPPWLARRIANQVPGAELFVIPKGTHYAAAVSPDLVADRLEAFLRSRTK
jgi:pimeloyl-ACP methyl ester carboxylesterase